MTDHLPECPASRPDTPHVVSIAAEACQFWGICDRLRACERRVREDDNRALWDDRQWNAALDAARDAVAAKRADFAYATDTAEGHTLLRVYDDALAAIDAIQRLIDGGDAHG